MFKISKYEEDPGSRTYPHFSALQRWSYRCKLGVGVS